MALQQTAGIAQVLQNSLLRNLLTTTTASYQQAQRALNTERFNFARFNLQSSLARRINTFEALTSTDQLLRTRLDLATDTLDSAGSNLNNLASLAALAIAESDPVQRASLQSQAESIINEIAN